MNKPEIFEALNQKASMTMIMDHDGEMVIKGKFCIIAPEENDIWDIWICNPKNIPKGLGPRKVNNICAALSLTTPQLDWVMLDREAWCKCEGTDTIIKNLVSLGIRRKRILSPEHLAQMKANLQRINHD